MFPHTDQAGHNMRNVPERADHLTHWLSAPHCDLPLLHSHRAHTSRSSHVAAGRALSYAGQQSGTVGPRRHEQLLEQNIPPTQVIHRTNPRPTSDPESNPTTHGTEESAQSGTGQRPVSCRAAERAPGRRAARGAGPKRPREQNGGQQGDSRARGWERERGWEPGVGVAARLGPGGGGGKFLEQKKGERLQRLLLQLLCSAPLRSLGGLRSSPGVSSPAARARSPELAALLLRCVAPAPFICAIARAFLCCVATAVCAFGWIAWARCESLGWIESRVVGLLRTSARAESLQRAESGEGRCESARGAWDVGIERGLGLSSGVRQERASACRRHGVQEDSEGVERSAEGSADIMQRR
jgi:hypothetical protein